MSLLKGRKLGWRTLRFKAAGADVRELQEFLVQQGYDLGEEHHYGYLTKDAVRQFQRDHGLVADGIAGPRFFALILEKDLPVRRNVHIVQAGETLEGITARYGVGLPALTNFKRTRRIYPGQRLVFFDREIWGVHGKSSVELPASSLTGVIRVPSFDGTVKDLPSIHMTGLGTEDGILRIHKLLRTRKQRKQTVMEISEEARGQRGVYLPWKEVASPDGRRYLSFLRLLRKTLDPKMMLVIELGLGVSPWRIWGGVDYVQVNNLADRVVLSLPVDEAPNVIINRVKTEKLLNALFPEIHSWKVLLRIPVFAIEWEMSKEEVSWIKLPYAMGLSRAFRYGASLEQDEKGGLFYRYRRRNSHYHLCLPQYKSLGEVFALANLYNLAGVILDQLGMEDPRVWDVLNSHFRAAKL